MKRTLVNLAPFAFGVVLTAFSHAKERTADEPLQYFLGAPKNEVISFTKLVSTISIIAATCGRLSMAIHEP